MRLRKLFINFLLLILLVFSSIFLNISYAGDFNNNAGGGNSSTATGGGGSGGKITFNTEQQGYRFTFVNTNTGTKIGNTLDILRSNPLSVVPAAYWFTGSAVESFNKITNDSYKFVVYSQIESKLSGKVKNYSPIPWWFDKQGANYGGESKSFKQWLLSSQAQQALSGYKKKLDVKIWFIS